MAAKKKAKAKKGKKKQARRAPGQANAEAKLTNPGKKIPKNFTGRTGQSD